MRVWRISYRLLLTLQLLFVINVPAQENCVPQNIPNLLTTIEKGNDRYKILNAIICVSKLTKDEYTKNLLKQKLENTLGTTKALPDGSFPSNEPELVVTLAKALETMEDTLGFRMIVEYFRNANWASWKDQEFFDGIAARIWYRADMIEVFFLALTHLPPTTSVLGRACEFFNANREERTNPQFVKAVLSALTRIEKKVQGADPYSAETCSSTFLTQLLNDQLYDSFTKRYMAELSTDEKEIVNRFLIRLQSKPDSLVAVKLGKSFFSVEWGKEYSTHIKSTTAACDTFKGESYDTQIDDLWGYRCAEKKNDFEEILYFFPDTAGMSCTLQKIHITHPSASNTILGVLQNHLSSRMGTGQKVSDVHDAGSAYWQDIMFWKWNGMEVYCFRNVMDSQWGRELPLIEIIARHSELTKIIEETNLAEDLLAQEDDSKERLANVLQYDLNRWRSRGIAQILHFINPDTIYTLLLDLLKWKASNQIERGAQLYLADLLAQSLSLNLGSLSERDKKRESLLTFGIQYSPGYDGMEYNHALMKTIFQEQLTGFWADEAFLWKLTKGSIPTSPNSALDVFKLVINTGEEFLRSHPESHVHKKVLFSVAAAHETGWSLSLASPADVYVNREQHLSNAPFHRQQAILLFEQFIREYPESPEAKIAREKLKRLKLNIDTNSRAFYYIWD